MATVKSVKVGGLDFALEKVINVLGHDITLTAMHPQYNVTIESLLEKIDPAAPNVAQSLMAIQYNTRYVPLTLPPELCEEGYIMKLATKHYRIPKWGALEALWKAVKSENNRDESREGNTNYIDTGTLHISVGSFTLMCLGLSQTHINTNNGGITGTYHPRAVFDFIANVPGYNFVINSLSAGYDGAKAKLATKLAAEQAQHKAAQEAQQKQAEQAAQEAQEAARKLAEEEAKKAADRAAAEELIKKTANRNKKKK